MAHLFQNAYRYLEQVQICNLLERSILHFEKFGLVVSIKSFWLMS